MYRSIARLLVGSLACAGVVMLSPVVLLAAGEVSVSPLIVDISGKARDILSGRIVIENTKSYKIDVYPIVNNVTVGEGGGVETFKDWGSIDKSTSLANWMSVTRAGLELMPGERREVPFTIEVNPNARPGVYHAAVTFVAGANVDDAQARIHAGATTMVNLTVLEDAVEFVQLKSFAPGSVFAGGSQAAFTYQIENIGDKPVAPSGDLIIYDRRGREVGTVPVNPDGIVVAPGETAELASVWSGASGLGRYRAYLDVRYGAGRPVHLTDTVYFFVAPWVTIAVVFVLLAGAVAVLAARWHKRTMATPVASYARAVAAAADESDTAVLTMPRRTHHTAHIPVVNLRAKRPDTQ